MSWESVTWRPLDATSLPAAAPLADAAGILRSAVEAAVSAERSVPVVLARAAVAEVARTALPDDAKPIATIEFVGAPRRAVLVAAPPTAEGAADDPTLEPTAAGARILEAVDEAIASLAGEGLGLGPAEAAAIAEEAQVVALRLDFEVDARPLGSLVLAVEAAAVAELAAHVAALRALEAAAAETATDPTATLSAAAAESPSAPKEGAPPEAREAEPRGPAIRSVALPDLGGADPGAPASTEASRSIDLLLGVQLQVSVEIGRARLPIRDVLALGPGSIVELDKLAGEKVDILVNGHPVAQGEVVVVDENFGVRITDVVSRQRRLLSADGAP